MRKLKPKGKRKKRQKGLGPQRRQYPARKPVLSVTIQGLPQLREGLNAHIRDMADALRMMSTAGIRAGEAGAALRETMRVLAPTAAAYGMDKSLIEMQMDNLHESIVRDVRVIRFKSKKWRVYADTKKAKNRNIPTTNTGTN